MSERGKRKEKRKETNTRGDRRGMSPASQANLEATKIKPGEVRNPKGWPKGKRHTDTLLAAGWEVFANKILDQVNLKRKAKRQAPITLDDSDIDPELEMWLKQMEKARNGDTKAFELIVAYGHGKPTTKVEVAGDPENPIKHEHDFAEAEAEVASWMEGWFGGTKKTKVAVKKKKHGDKATDTGTAQ